MDFIIEQFENFRLVDDGFVRALAPANSQPPAQNIMEPKEVELKNTVAYLCHFYAVNHSTIYMDSMKKYGTKLTKDYLNTTFTNWKKLLKIKRTTEARETPQHAK